MSVFFYFSQLLSQVKPIEKLHSMLIELVLLRSYVSDDTLSLRNFYKYLLSI